MISLQVALNRQLNLEVDNLIHQEERIHALIHLIIVIVQLRHLALQKLTRILIFTHQLDSEERNRASHIPIKRGLMPCVIVTTNNRL